MGHRQKGKHRKRNPGWHARGAGPDRAYRHAAQIFLRMETTGVDATLAAPARVLHGKSKRNRGEAAP